MATDIRHPWFARCYALVSEGAERAGAVGHRTELLAGLTGRVIEVGCGNGMNFAHYPAEVTQVVAVEPEPYLRAKAVDATRRSPVPIEVRPGTAEALPAEDGSFDAAVVSLVLCSVPDPGVALAEARRVLRPGGTLRFYEHVRATTPGLARLQDRIDRLWPRLAGGCHPNRDTVAAIEAAGFTIEQLRRFTFRPCWAVAPVAPHTIGAARRP